MTGSIHRDPAYLEPPEVTEEGDVERREDAYWAEVDRAYDELRDRQLESREEWGRDGD